MRRLVPLLAAAALVAGCSPSTLGAPTGDVTLVATFPDVQNLVAGHSVQMSDIPIGSVVSVKRVGYQAEVRFSIEDDYRIPEGAAAEIAQTSLLGENYVELTLPDGSDMTTGPFLRDGARITRTSVAPQFEQVAGDAGRILEAISGDDLATLVNETATALDGQGPALNKMVAQSADLVAAFAEQRDDLGRAIGRLADLGETLKAHNGTLRTSRINETIGLIERNKTEILGTVEDLTKTARRLNDKVFAGRAEKMRLLIKRLDPTLATLGGSSDKISALVKSLVGFQEVLPKVVWDGQLMVYGALKLGLYNNASEEASDVLPFLDQIIQGGGR
ncbi:phospholipid/cholesterol/gamma-HCH transport system substrate-binding protein [Actinocorallia herbida]|uniref:Phospholipid/cholesterol/gamma-HCH transport system substrate-binding protein n=1 Tax=Actinocorallia herbida TaxID=58109 RepID=A0A3N1D9I8_9ACTN|nr:MCE family protein [Actinocorallia herbida]ROO89748.1 phospholipid/cholesterol/gamma-HCH transport system substrate-binding protein [Actinocorallia herbida]